MPYCPACTSNVQLGATKCESCGASFQSPVQGLFESRLTAEQEAAIPFPKPVPVVFGLLGIGGAAWGMLAIAALATQWKGGLVEVLFLIAAAAAYLFSGYCGLRALQRRYGWVRLNQLLWCAQVPSLVSPLVSYSFSTGGFIAAWVQVNPEFRLGGDAWLGSTFKVNLFTPGPITLGVNLIALGLAYYLSRAQQGDSLNHDRPMRREA